MTMVNFAVWDVALPTPRCCCHCVYNKKAPKLLKKALVQTFLCTAYPFSGKADENRNRISWLDAARFSPRILPAKPSPIAWVTGASAPIGKNITPYSAVSASGIFTPFLCICAEPRADHVPYAKYSFFAFVNQLWTLSPNLSSALTIMQKRKLIFLSTAKFLRIRRRTLLPR